MPSTPVFASDRARRGTAVLMILEAASLAVVSVLHLSGLSGGGTRPYDARSAGTAEAIIGVILVAGAVALMLSRPYGRRIARIATGFAIVGFLVGLTFTLAGGTPADVAYHATVLPVLALTFLLLTMRRASGGAKPAASSPRRPRSGR